MGKTKRKSAKWMAKNAAPGGVKKSGEKKSRGGAPAGEGGSMAAMAIGKGTKKSKKKKNRADFGLASAEQQLDSALQMDEILAKMNAAAAGVGEASSSSSSVPAALSGAPASNADADRAAKIERLKASLAAAASMGAEFGSEDEDEDGMEGEGMDGDLSDEESPEQIRAREEAERKKQMPAHLVDVGYDGANITMDLLQARVKVIVAKKGWGRPQFKHLKERANLYLTTKCALWKTATAKAKEGKEKGNGVERTMFKPDAVQLEQFERDLVAAVGGAGGRSLNLGQKGPGRSLGAAGAGAFSKSAGSLVFDSKHNFGNRFSFEDKMRSNQSFNGVRHIRVGASKKAAASSAHSGPLSAAGKPIKKLGPGGILKKKVASASGGGAVGKMKRVKKKLDKKRRNAAAA